MKNNPASLLYKTLGVLFAGGFMTVWVLGWSAGTLFFDTMIVSSAWKQYDSQHWVSTPGTIRKSTVRVSSDSDGTSYSLDIEYTYALDGKSLTGTRDSYTSSFMDGKASKYARAAELKPGRTVTVYYNPENPSEAVLRNSLTSRDVAGVGLMTLFITPFNIIMLGSWYAALSVLSGRIRKDPPAGVSRIESGTNSLIRLPHLSALCWAGMAVGGTAFAMIFVVMIAALIFNIPQLSFAGWAAVLLAGLIAYTRRAKQVGEGRFDLTIDRLRSTLTVPPCDEKREAVQFKLAELNGITLEKEESTDSDGDVTRKWWTTLLYGDNQRAQLHALRTEDDAKHFATWLAGTLKTEYRESALN